MKTIFKNSIQLIFDLFMEAREIRKTEGVISALSKTAIFCIFLIYWLFVMGIIALCKIPELISE